VDRSDGTIMRTEAYSPSEVLEYARRMVTTQSTRWHSTSSFEVVIEKGPEWQQHSPITRSVETNLLDIFPKAHLVTPNRWKGHPAAKCSEKLGTKHEKDAVRLARWFIKSQPRTNANAKDNNKVENKVSNR
jgi:hypothetical protein